MLHRIGKKFFFALVATACLGIFHTTVFAKQVEMTLVYDGASHKYSAEEIRINVDDFLVTDYVMPPVIIEGRTLVPARAVFEAMKAEVNWNPDTKEVYIIKDGDVVVIQVDNTKGTINGEPFTMEVGPKIINDSTMIPVRQVAEALGCNVGWDNDARVVFIRGTQKETPEEIPPIGGTEEETPVIPAPSEPVPETPVIPPVIDVPVETPNVPIETSPITGNEISVQSISLPSNGSTDFLINASGVIERYQVMEVSENRLVVDIYQANMAIANTNMTVTGNSYVSSIRSAQNQVTPEKITRIVFDLTSTCKYEVLLSNDKKSIIIRFSENTITNVNVGNQGSMDYISIGGEAAPGIQISTLTNPKRLVLDIPNAKSNLMDSYSAQGCNFISDIRTSQFNENLVRIVLTVPENIELEYTLTQSGTNTLMELRKSSLQNLSYNPSAREIELKGLTGVQANQVIHNDNYLNKQYTLTLPGDYSSILGYGSRQISDSFLNQITVRNNTMNQTEIVLDEAQILAYTVTEGANGLSIKVQIPKEKYNTVIVLDAGHGKSDPGTNGNGYDEKNINLSVLQKVYARMQNDTQIKVYATRLTDDYPTNPARAAMANEIADMFISIHQNSAWPNTVPSGTEILYTPHDNEIDGKLTSKQAATVMLDYVLQAMGSKNRGIKNDPAIIVLNQTKVPAILIECGFLSNPEEAVKLGSEEYQNALADAIVAGIHDMVKNYKLR